MRNMRAATAFSSAILLCILSLSPVLQAQQKGAPQYQELADSFFEILQQGKSAEAIDFLFATNPNIQQMPDTVKQLKAQFASLQSMVGPYSSRHLIIEAPVAGIFVYQHYLVAYQRQPISVRIKFYKPGEKWVCQGLQFDTNLEDAIQRGADDRIPLSKN